jgi:hypothetical protein
MAFPPGSLWSPGTVFGVFRKVAGACWAVVVRALRISFTVMLVLALCTGLVPFALLAGVLLMVLLFVVLVGILVGAVLGLEGLGTLFGWIAGSGRPLPLPWV